MHLEDKPDEADEFTIKPRIEYYKGKTNGISPKDQRKDKSQESRKAGGDPTHVMDRAGEPDGDQCSMATKRPKRLSLDRSGRDEESGTTRVRPGGRQLWSTELRSRPSRPKRRPGQGPTNAKGDEGVKGGSSQLRGDNPRPPSR